MNKTLSFVLFVLVFVPALSFAECKVVIKWRVGLAFINGVDNNPQMAQKSAGNLENITHRPVTLFYNHTEGLTLDLLEAFEQRMAEMPLSLRDRYELYHEFLLGGGTLTALLSQSVPGIAHLAQSFGALAAQMETKTMQHPITNFDYAEHNRQLRQMVADNDRDKDSNTWHAFTTKGICHKESVHDNIEVELRDGAVYQISGSGRDPITGQTWRHISRCVSDTKK